MEFPRGRGPSGKIMEIPGGGGSTVKPIGTENPGGVGGQTRKILREGGTDIFWNYTMHSNLVDFL